jgi:hypothetical protein
MFELYIPEGDKFVLVSSHETLDICHEEATTKGISIYLVEKNNGSISSQVFKSKELTPEVQEEPVLIIEE